MSYVFTDDDYDTLYGVKNQLALMASLLSTAKRVECDSDYLEMTFWALQEPISKVLDILDAREEVTRLSEGMKPHHWAQIINLVSGRDSMTVSDIVKMDDRLAKCVVSDPDTLVIFNVWRAVITREGIDPMMTADGSLSGFRVKFEQPIKPEIPPATVRSVMAFYGAKNEKELLKNLVAVHNGKDPRAKPESGLKVMAGRKARPTQHA